MLLQRVGLDVTICTDYQGIILNVWSDRVIWRQQLVQLATPLAIVHTSEEFVKLLVNYCLLVLPDLNFKDNSIWISTPHR